MSLFYFVDPSCDFVDGGFWEVELVFLEDVTELLLEALGLLSCDVLDEVEASLAEYWNEVLGDTNLGPLGNRRLRNFLLRLHLREQHDLANSELTSHQHDQAVDTDTDTEGRRHTILQRAQEIVVDDHRLVVTLVGKTHLRDETLLLIDRIVELRIGIGQLLTVDHQLETLGEAGLRAVHLGKR